MRLSSLFLYQPPYHSVYLYAFMYIRVQRHESMKGCARQLLLRPRLERRFWQFTMDGACICGSNDAVYLLELPKISLKVSLAFLPASTHTNRKFRTLYSHKNNCSFSCHPGHYHCCHGFGVRWRGSHCFLPFPLSDYGIHCLLSIHSSIHLPPFFFLTHIHYNRSYSPLGLTASVYASLT